jgi:(p)ppGpp synthase/HD superfamily hydrolase
MKQNYTKMKIALRAFLQGKGYFTALRAMDFAEKLHDGVRKDGQPEFSHQVSQALYAITLVDLLNHPEETIAVIFLHDTIEDKDVTHGELIKLFGITIADATLKMSKVVNGFRIPDEIYYDTLTNCPIASVAKGFDRIHNLLTMLGGFSVTKRVSYIQETMDKTVPMLKIARRRFPEQLSVYENIKFVMTNQVQLYNALNEEDTEKLS